MIATYTENEDVTKLEGFYRGTVLKHLPNGMCKVFIYGVYNDIYILKPECLPNAEIAAPLFGGSNNGNGMFSYPNIGSTVWCFFQNCDQNLPVIFASTLGGHNANLTYNDTFPYRKCELERRELNIADILTLNAGNDAIDSDITRGHSSINDISASNSHKIQTQYANFSINEGGTLSSCVTTQRTFIDKNTYNNESKISQYFKPKIYGQNNYFKNEYISYIASCYDESVEPNSAEILGSAESEKMLDFTIDEFADLYNVKLVAKSLFSVYEYGKVKLNAIEDFIKGVSILNNKGYILNQICNLTQCSTSLIQQKVTYDVNDNTNIISIRNGRFIGLQPSNSINMYTEKTDNANITINARNNIISNDILVSTTGDFISLNNTNISAINPMTKEEKTVETIILGHGILLEKSSDTILLEAPNVIIKSTNFIVDSSSNINIKTPNYENQSTAVAFQSSTINANGSTVNINGGSGDAVINGISLVNHTHIGNHGAKTSPPM